MERRSTAEGVPAMSAGDLDDVPNGGGREWAAFEDTATYQIFGQAWRDRIERNRRAMTFSEGAYSGDPERPIRPIVNT